MFVCIDTHCTVGMDIVVITKYILSLKDKQQYSIISPIPLAG